MPNPVSRRSIAIAAVIVIAAAIGGLQRAKQALDEAQDKALRAAGLVTRDDFKHAGKRISALKRRVRELADDLDQLIDQQKK